MVTHKREERIIIHPRTMTQLNERILTSCGCIVDSSVYPMMVVCPSGTQKIAIPHINPQDLVMLVFLDDTKLYLDTLSHQIGVPCIAGDPVTEKVNALYQQQGGGQIAS